MRAEYQRLTIPNAASAIARPAIASAVHVTSDALPTLMPSSTILLKRSGCATLSNDVTTKVPRNRAMSGRYGRAYPRMRLTVPRATFCPVTDRSRVIDWYVCQTVLMLTWMTDRIVLQVDVAAHRVRPPMTVDRGRQYAIPLSGLAALRCPTPATAR